MFSSQINPLFPALRSGPTARSGAYPKSKFLAAKTTHSTHFREMRIVGFLDDNFNLKRRLLDGFRIHGSVEDLPALAERLNLHGVLITMTRLDSDRADLLNRVVEEAGLTLYRWRPQLHCEEVEPHEGCDDGGLKAAS